jgi:predicted NBD/HSP70 family sugar kinase
VAGRGGAADEHVAERGALLLAVVRAPQQRRGGRLEVAQLHLTHGLEVDGRVRVRRLSLADHLRLRAGEREAGAVVVLGRRGAVGARDDDDGVVVLRRVDRSLVDGGQRRGVGAAGDARQEVDGGVRVDGLHRGLDALVVVDLLGLTRRALDAAVAAQEHAAAGVGEVAHDGDLVRADAGHTQRQHGVARDLVVLEQHEAVSAPVTATTHALRSDRILSAWSGIDLATELAGRTGLPVEVGNDANLGAIAEHRFGVARGVDDFFYVMLSDGVGAGLVLGGQLYEGAVGGAGELGHVTVVPGGLVCRCGNRGCLETVVGARALAGALAFARGAQTTVDDVLAAAERLDHGALRVLQDAGRAVGEALAPICTVLDPSLVVIGGRCASSGALLDGVREQLTRSVTPLRRNVIPVAAGALDDRAEMLGAVALVARRMRIG